RSPRLQRFVLRCHERAWRQLLTRDEISSVLIVGGGLFPRTALILQKLLPRARITILDASDCSLRVAEPLLPDTVQRIHAFYEPSLHRGFELVVLPLAYIGDRRQFYDSPSAPLMVIHDWLWRRRGRSCVISWLLFKRMNLIRASDEKMDNLAEQSLR